MEVFDNVEVTIVLICHNRGEMLLECVDSIQKQSSVSWEIIAIDFSSTDDTYPKLRELALNDKKIKVLRGRYFQKPDYLNEAIANSTGQYLLFIDPSFKFSKEDSLAMLVNAARRSSANIVGCLLDNSEGAPYPCLYEQEEDKWVTASEMTSFLWYQRFLYKKEFLSKSNIAFKKDLPLDFYQEPIFFLSAIVKSGKVLTINCKVMSHTSSLEVRKYKTLQELHSNFSDFLESWQEVLITVQDNKFDKMQRALDEFRIESTVRFFLELERIKLENNPTKQTNDNRTDYVSLSSMNARTKFCYKFGEMLSGHISLGEFVSKCFAYARRKIWR